jgi:uncharacterized protein
MALKVSVRVTTGTRKREVRWDGDVLQVRLTAPPVEGKANDELIRYLAETFDVKRNEITIIRGERSRHKMIGMPFDKGTFLARAEALGSEP